MKTDKEIENELVSMYRARAEHYKVPFNEYRIRKQVRKSLVINLPKNPFVLCNLHSGVGPVRVKRAHFAAIHGYTLEYAKSRGFAKEIEE